MRFVLVPGAGGAAWYWHLVAPLIAAAGHQAVAVDLPGDDVSAGLPQYADRVEGAADGRDDVVLVGQSLGGFSVAAAMERIRPVRIVLVNAMIPVPGETAGAWWDATGAPAARAEAAEKGGYPAEFDEYTYFAHDVPPHVWEGGADQQRPEADAVFADACAFSTWPAPVEVVVGGLDRFFPPAFQQRVAQERLGAGVTTIEAGHLPALADPDAVAAVLLG